jgi:flagellar motor switch protein FliM
MAEILSQEEIDALLSALEGEGVGAEEPPPREGVRRVKDYDFRRPDKFSKDQIRSLHMVMDAFARSWSTFLSGKLRALVHLEVVSIEQLPYEEFIKSTFTPSVIAIISMEPLEGSCVIDISPPLAFAIIERLVGGTGGASGSPRELTEIEEALVETVVADGLRVLRNAMSDVVQVNPRLEAIEYNPQFAKIVPPSEMTIFTSLEMRIEPTRGIIGICLPYMLLEPLLPDLSTERFFRITKEDQEESENRSEVVLRSLGTTLLHLKAELGSVELSVNDVLSLSVGDVITLSTRLDDPLRVYVGDDPKPRFLARPGEIGRNKGIEIMDYYEE